MKKSIYALLLLLGAVLLTMSCKKRDSVEDDEDYMPELELQLSDERFAFPVSYLGELDEDDLEAFQIYAPNLSTSIDSDTKSFIVVNQQYLSGNEKILAEAFEKGCAIGFLNPDPEIINKWVSEYTSSPLSVPMDDNCYIYCMSNNNASYTETFPYIDEGSDLDPDDELLDWKYCFDPLMNWVNGQLPGTSDSYSPNETKAEDKDKEDAIHNRLGIQRSHTFRFGVNKQIWKIGPGYDPDTLNGTGAITVAVSFVPIYCYEGQDGASGDYYDVIATSTVASKNMFRGSKVRKEHKIGATTFTAYFLKNFAVDFYLTDSNGNIFKEFSYVPNNSPIPESTQLATKYSKTNGWNIGLGLSLGISGNPGKAPTASEGTQTEVQNNLALMSENPDIFMGKRNSAVGLKAGLNFTFGYTSSRTVEMNQPDMSIKNTSEPNCASWIIECKNLPHEDTHAKHDISDYCPNIASSNLTFNSKWIWYHSKTKDRQTGDLGTLHFKVKAEYDGVCTDSQIRYAKTLTQRENTYTFQATSPGYKFNAPARIPFGTINIQNTFSGTEAGYKMTNLAIKDSQGNVIVEDESSKAYGEKYEYNLPTGEYFVSFKAGSKRFNIKEYCYMEEANVPAKVKIAKRTKDESSIRTLKSDFDFDIK